MSVSPPYPPALVRPDTHTSPSLPPLPVFEPHIPSFEYNAAIESWLAVAYASSVPIWRPDDSQLIEYLSSEAVERRIQLRGHVFSLAQRVYTSVKLDGLVRRWRRLPPDHQMEILLSRFLLEADDARRQERPDPRLDMPEVTLHALLDAEGAGFNDLAEALCFEDEAEMRDGHFPILANGPWEDKNSLPADPAIAISRARRAYVEDDINLMACGRCRQKANRNVEYCSGDCQKKHWKDYHESICGKTSDEITVAASFPTLTTTLSLPLIRRRRWLDAATRQDCFWLVDVFGTAQTLIPPTNEPYAVQRAMSTELRRAAFEAIENCADLGGEAGISLGVIALCAQANIDLPGLDPEAMLAEMAGMFRLTRGGLQVRMDAAKEEMDRAEEGEHRDWDPRAVRERLFGYFEKRDAPLRGTGGNWIFQ
ncbi:hypothetical protein JCM8097_002277 [Rhodosporidiobolus ruineniae]